MSVTVICVPAGWSLVPEIARSAPFSVALMMSSTAMVLMPSIGAPSATVTVCEAVPLLPAESVTVAVMVPSPCASAEMTLAGPPMLPLPFASSPGV